MHSRSTSHAHPQEHEHGHEHDHGGVFVSGGDEMDSKNLSEDESEARALTDVIAAFLCYKTYTLNSGVYRRLQAIDQLSDRHRSIVSSLGTIDKIKRAERLVRENYKFLLDVAYSSAIGPMPDPASQTSEFKEWMAQFFEARRAAGRPLVEDHHMEKLYSTLKQFVRDWSAEGREEREQTYGPLLNALEREFAHVKPESRGAIRVLVPGAGLGRLAFDICCRGFSSQGNEFSYFMLLASNYVLNKTERVSQHAIYPFVHQFSNVVKEEDQVRAVRIPDILPSQMPFADTAEFSMTAGDFIEVYGAEDEKGRWDAIVTCFFMDTAKNVLAYLDTMWSAMKPGAVWINLGPLLWHFDSVQGESSVEFTREEFMALAEKIGFVWDGEQFQECIPVSYTSNSRSMLQYTYRAFMTVAHKPNQAAGNTIAN